MAVLFSAVVKPSSCSQKVSWTATAGSIGGELFTVPLAQALETMTVTVTARQVEDPYAVGTAVVTIKKKRKPAAAKLPKLVQSPTIPIPANSTAKKP